uniref:Uncharacterized protein n=1 Tax=Rhizophora mucronata TaxID=61149 RepID=A0A2P2Q055_RHIMU
MGKLIFVVREK